MEVIFSQKPWRIDFKNFFPFFDDLSIGNYKKNFPEISKTILLRRRRHTVQREKKLPLNIEFDIRLILYKNEANTELKWF